MIHPVIFTKTICDLEPKRIKGPSGRWVSNGFNGCGVYVIVGPKGRRYVGGSLRILYRWKLHVRMLRSNNHRNLRLQASWNESGEDKFKFQLVETCSEDALRSREQFWLDRLGRNSYNICSVVDSPPPSFGRKHKPQVLARIVSNLVEHQRSDVGRKRRSDLSKVLWKDPEHRARIAKSRADYWANPDNRAAAKLRAERQHASGNFGRQKFS